MSLFNAWFFAAQHSGRSAPILAFIVKEFRRYLHVKTSVKEFEGASPLSHQLWEVSQRSKMLWKLDENSQTRHTCRFHLHWVAFPTDVALHCYVNSKMNRCNGRAISFSKKIFKMESKVIQNYNFKFEICIFDVSILSSRKSLLWLKCSLCQ